MSYLGYLFMGFLALVIICQVVPACLLFFGMIKGILAGRSDQSAESETGRISPN